MVEHLSEGCRIIGIANIFTCENRDGYQKDGISILGRNNLYDAETISFLITRVYILILAGMVHAQSTVAKAREVS